MTMISLQAQIQQMGIGAAGANGEVRYGSMFNDFDNDITSKIKIHPSIMKNLISMPEWRCSEKNSQIQNLFPKHEQTE